VPVFHHSLTVKDHFSFVKTKNTYKIKKGSQGTVAETKNMERKYFCESKRFFCSFLVY